MRRLFWGLPTLIALIYALVFGLGARVISFPFALTPAVLWLPEIVTGLIVFQIFLGWLGLRGIVAGFVLGLKRWWGAFVLEGLAVVLVLSLSSNFISVASRDAARFVELSQIFVRGDTSRRRSLPSDMEAEYRLNHILDYLNRGQFAAAQASLQAHVNARPPLIGTHGQQWPGHRLLAESLEGAIQSRQDMAIYLRGQAHAAGWPDPKFEPRALRIAYFLEILEPGNELSEGVVAYFQELEDQIHRTFVSCETQSLDRFVEQLAEDLVLDRSSLNTRSRSRNACVNVQRQIESQWVGIYPPALLDSLSRLIAFNKSHISNGRWTIRTHPDYPYRSIGNFALSELWLEWTSSFNFRRGHCLDAGITYRGYSPDLSLIYWHCDNYLDAVQ